MSNKKHYWTQVFLVTTLVSCGLGLVTGFVGSGSPSVEKRTQDFAYIQLESALRESTMPQPTWIGTWGSLSPLAQPGATVIAPFSVVQPGATIIEFEPYYDNRIEALPHNINRQSMPPSAGVTVQGSLPYPYKSSHSCCMDATPIMVLLLTLMIGLPMLLRRLFVKFVMNLFRPHAASSI